METTISKGIIKEFFDELIENLNVDIAIAGAGPSGLVAGAYLGKKKLKVCIFEKRLSIGGGLWGGGMMFNKIVVQKEALEILNECGIKYKKFENLYVANSVETTGKLIANAIDNGVKIFNGVFVEDVIIKNNKIEGFVINWGAVSAANLHVDPLSIKAKFCIDATGHPAEVCNVVVRKVGNLNTPNGKIEGEKSMDVENAEKLVVENTKEVYPNLYVTGMAANAVFGAPRMGPIFGGMLLSGIKVAELIIERMKMKK